MLHSTLYIMSHMQLQNFKLCIYKKIHYMTLARKGHTQCCPVPSHHMPYAHAKFEVATCNGLGGGAFTRKYII